MKTDFRPSKTTISFKDRVIGRLLAQPIFTKDGKVLIAQSNTPLTTSLISEIEKKANLESELSNYMQESINMVGAASPAPVVEIGEKT